MEKEKQKRGRKPKEVDLEKLRHFCARGLTLAEIAQEFNCYPNSIKRVLDKENIQIDKSKRVSKSKAKNQKRWLAIAAYYLENHSLEETGAKFGMTRERVRQILNEQGIKPRPHTFIVRETLTKNRPNRFTSQERFWNFVDKSPHPKGCWVWTSAPRGDRGYGAFSYKGKGEYAHHLAFLFSNGHRAKKWVLHHCDNPTCVNPEHLYDGTPQDNVRDRDNRGRNAWQKDREGMLKKHRERMANLAILEVKEIKRRLAKGESAYKISKDFPVTPTTIYSIKYGKSWVDVTI